MSKKNPLEVYPNDKYLHDWVFTMQRRAFRDPDYINQVRCNYVTTYSSLAGTVYSACIHKGININQVMSNLVNQGLSKTTTDWSFEGYIYRYLTTKYGPSAWYDFRTNIATHRGYGHIRNDLVEDAFNHMKGIFNLKFK